MAFRLKNTLFRDVTELAEHFNKLLGCTITDTMKMAVYLNGAPLQGDEIKIAEVKVSKDTKTQEIRTLEIVLNGLQDGEIIESRKLLFQLQDCEETSDPEINVTVENVTEGKISSDLKTTPYFLAEIDEEVFFSFFEQVVQ